VTNSTGTVDPSTIPGYYGEFATAGSSGAKTNNAIFLDVGEDFSFGYDTNEAVLDATKVEEQTDKTSVIQKLVLFPGIFL